MSNLFDTLNARGYIYQATHIEDIKKSINGDPITFYMGIDPTADSLHIGHFFALMMFRYLQDAGHKGILVVGGATALIGDPSGKSDLRKMLTKAEVKNNIEEVKKLAKRFIITDGDNPALILDNADWINEFSFVDFMRDVGVHFNVNRMLSAETYANRLKEGGLTFLEMGYMLMQSFDFVHLNKNYGTILQIGGSDQWGNIVAGTNLGRKLSNMEDVDYIKGEMFGLTCPLLMTKEGKKMGKSETGTLWVAREKTTVFDFYQYFYNVKDEDVEQLLKLFTKIPLDEIAELIESNIVLAKQRMAYEVTKLVHGIEEADKVLETVKSLYKDGGASESIPVYEFEKNDFKNGKKLIELLLETALFSSKSEAKRMIIQGGISIDSIKVADVDKTITLDDFNDESLIIKKGKKKFVKVKF